MRSINKLKSILKKGMGTTTIQKKKKHVSFAKPIKTTLIIERRNKGELVNPETTSKIKDDLKLQVQASVSHIRAHSAITQVDIQLNIMKFLKTLGLQIINSTIVYNSESSNKILYTQSALQYIKNATQLSIVPFKHNKESKVVTRDLFLVNPNYKSIEWLSCVYNIDKELYKKLKEIFKSIGYHLVSPTILPQPCTEFMLFFVDFKSKHPLLNHQAFHSKLNRLDNTFVKTQILNINFKLTASNKLSYQSKITKLHKMTPEDIHKSYQKLI